MIAQTLNGNYTPYNALGTSSLDISVKSIIDFLPRAGVNWIGEPLFRKVSFNSSKVCSMRLYYLNCYPKLCGWYFDLPLLLTVIIIIRLCNMNSLIY